jgi:hypothetical protein
MLNPADRITAEAALRHDFFSRAPTPTSPEKLPQPKSRADDPLKRAASPPGPTASKRAKDGSKKVSNGESAAPQGVAAPLGRREGNGGQNGWQDCREAGHNAAQAGEGVTNGGVQQAQQPIVCRHKGSAVEQNGKDSDGETRLGGSASVQTANGVCLSTHASWEYVKWRHFYVHELLLCDSMLSTRFSFI